MQTDFDVIETCTEELLTKRRLMANMAPTSVIGAVRAEIIRWHTFEK